MIKFLKIGRIKCNMKEIIKRNERGGVENREECKTIKIKMDKGV